MATTISFPRTTTSSQLQKILRLCVSSCARRKQHAKRATAAPLGRAVVAERQRWIVFSEGDGVVAGVPPARLENCSRHGCLYRNCRFNALGQRVPHSVYKKPAHSLEHLIEFLRGHLSDRVKNDVLFDAEKALRANKAWAIDLAALTIAFIERNSESIPVRAAGDLAKNQICAGKIGNHQSRPPLFAIGSRKRNDNDFACYRFDH